VDSASPHRVILFYNLLKVSLKQIVNMHIKLRKKFKDSLFFEVTSHLNFSGIIRRMDNVNYKYPRTGYGDYLHLLDHNIYVENEKKYIYI
jgi:hypothetical protein